MALGALWVSLVLSGCSPLCRAPCVGANSASEASWPQNKSIIVSIGMIHVFHSDPIYRASRSMIVRFLAEAVLFVKTQCFWTKACKKGAPKRQPERWHKIWTKSDQIWTKSDQIWTQSGQNLDRIWTESGQNLHRICTDPASSQKAAQKQSNA